MQPLIEYDWCPSKKEESEQGHTHTRTQHEDTGRGLEDASTRAGMPNNCQQTTRHQARATEQMRTALRRNHPADTLIAPRNVRH